MSHIFRILVPILATAIIFHASLVLAAGLTTLTGEIKYHPGLPNSDDYPFYYVDVKGQQTELSLCRTPGPTPGCQIATKVVGAVGRIATVTGTLGKLPGGELLFPDRMVLEVSAITVIDPPFVETPLKPPVATLLNQAREAYQKKNFTKTVELCTQAINQDPKAAGAYFLRGDARDELGQFDLAIKDFDKAIEVDPKFVEAYRYRGIFYARKKQYDQAMTNYTQAIALDPKHGKTYVNRGNLFQAFNKPGEACSDYQKACQLGQCQALDAARKQKYCP